MTALPTPEELAERQLSTDAAPALVIAVVLAIRADRESIAAVLREEAAADVQRAFETRHHIEVRARYMAKARRLGAFADRLAPPPPERPAAEIGDPIAMSTPGYCPACTGRTVVLGQLDPYDPCPVCGPSALAALALGPMPFLDASPPVATEPLCVRVLHDVEGIGTIVVEATYDEGGWVWTRCERPQGRVVDPFCLTNAENDAIATKLDHARRIAIDDRERAAAHPGSHRAAARRQAGEP